MKKGRIADIYVFLAKARMTKLTDDEKVVIITMLRQMKPVANEVTEAVQEASRKALEEYPNDIHSAQKLVNKSIEGLMNEEVDSMNLRVFKQDAFNRLCFSNEWTFEQIDNLQQDILFTE